MSKTDLQTLIQAIKDQGRWPDPPGDKAGRYVGRFFNRTHTGSKITAQVEGNHGTYTVSIQAEAQSLVAACSCYVGQGGYCHHCHALALTFLRDPIAFAEIKPQARDQVQSLAELETYLKGVTLEALLKELRASGMTQKAFAQAIRMNPRHLSAVKSSELRNRYYNELGAIKLACLWVLEHLKQ